MKIESKFVISRGEEMLNFFFNYLFEMSERKETTKKRNIKVGLIIIMLDVQNLPKKLPIFIANFHKYFPFHCQSEF